LQQLAGSRHKAEVSASLSQLAPQKKIKMELYAIQNVTPVFTVLDRSVGKTALKISVTMEPSALSRARMEEGLAR
jgi:hypothetical protein